MRKPGILTAPALGLLLATGLAAGGVLPVRAAARPSAAAAHSASTAARPASGSVLRATLENGLRVVIVRDTLAPMVTTQITYLAGSYEAPPGFPGTAHALEHMMFRDSRGMTGAQLNEMTGKMGATNNAFTTNDATQFYFVAPAQYLGILLHIEATRMRGAKLTDAGWGLEKGAIEQEVSRDISQPSYLAFEQAERILYAGTGYAEDPLGSRPSFDATTGAVLRKFYDRWYVPNNAILVIVGDVDPAATLSKVKALFGPIRKGTVPARPPVELGRIVPQTIARTTPDATGLVQYLYRMPGMRSPDYAAVQVLMDVLNNARSTLSDLAAKGKVLFADAGVQPFTHGGVGVIEASFPKGGDGKRAEHALDGVIAALRKRGVPADLVDAAKRQERAQFEFARNSAVDLASAWSQALAWQGLESPREALNQIERVSVDDVNRVAREYLKASDRVAVVLTPSSSGRRPPNSTGFGGTETFASNDKLNVPLPEWASKPLAQLEMPHWTLAPVSMRLPNGITLIVQPESVSKTVTVVGHVDHDDGLQEPKGEEGVGRLVDALFDYGTTTLDRNAYHAALDAIAASASGGTDFHLAVPSDHFARGMRLLAEDELHPALPQSAFEVQQRVLARTLAGQLQSPQYKMMRALMKGLLPTGDPGLRQATPATVEKLTLAQARDYFAQVYRPDMTTIVVVGDVTPQQARAMVERYFGAWKAHGPKPDVIPKSVPLNAARYTVVPNGYSSQDEVLMGQMMALDLHDPARYALQLGNEVLGGNGFASRLMVDIRVRHGYAYGAASGMRFQRSRSIFFVQYGSDPDKVRAVDGLILKNLAEMRDAPVKRDELTNARQARIRSIPLAVSSVDRIARALLTWSYLGEPLDEPMVAARYYLTLTANQVRDAFQKYIEPNHLVQVVQGPAPRQH